MTGVQTCALPISQFGSFLEIQRRGQIVMAEELQSKLRRRQYYLCLTRLAEGVSMDQMKAMLPEHLQWVQGLERDGTILAAGKLLCASQACCSLVTCW